MSATIAAKRLMQTFHEARQKKSYYQKIHSYQGYVNVHYETDDFLVTTATVGRELLKILELRHEVFVEEWQGRRAYHRLDVDDYDFSGDHLMIVDKATSDVVGTYRLLSSHFTQNFYSTNEFHIQQFFRLPTVKLEMGRACIRPSHRTGATIDLLWKGLARYIVKTRTEFMFGCSSVRHTDAGLISRLVASLRANGQWSDEYTVRPTEDYKFSGYDGNCTGGLTKLEQREIVPPLLRSYLQAGAKVYGAPALDADFLCTDMLTILDWKALHPKFLAHFVHLV